MAIRHQAVWLEANEFPCLCFFCDEMITEQRGWGGQVFTIHHVNGNHDDNRLENMVACHRACHARHHGYGNVNARKPKRRVICEHCDRDIAMNMRNRHRCIDASGVNRNEVPFEFRQKMSRIVSDYYATKRSESIARDHVIQYRITSSGKRTTFNRG